MKKLISIILAALMLASVASAAVSAEVIYFDDFNNGLNTDFWGGIGEFQVEESDNEDAGGVMSGWSTAKIAQAFYLKNDDDSFVDKEDEPTSWCYKKLTMWTDVRVEADGDSDTYESGLWLCDTTDLTTGFATARTVYYFGYCAMSVDDDDNEEYAYLTFYSDNPVEDENYPNHVYAKVPLPEAGQIDEDTDEFVPGFNLYGEAVKLGLRFGEGNITAYANGRIVGSYNYETIGASASPLLYYNIGNRVEFDNFGLGTYDHNVKKETRNASYDLAESAVVVFAGDNVTTEMHLEDEPVTVTAPAAPAGQVFDKWQMKIGGREVSDAPNNGDVEHITITPFEAAKLLHGIEISDLNSAELTFTMPNEKVELVATYKEAEVEPAKAITVVGGTADVAEADAGATVTITADAPAEGMVFDKWEVVSGGVELANVNAATTTFTMGNADVEVKATYKVKDASTEYAITVNGGTASAEKAVTGTVVTITANEAPEGQVFDKWEVVSGGVELANANEASTTFTMGEAAVEIKATYKSSVVDVTPGDVNGDTRVNAKDIIAVMKFMLGNAPEGFIEAAGDLNGDNRINAKDIILIMKIMLGGK